MALVEELEIGCRADVQEVRPLTGGVASDIGVVRLTDRVICVKFALGKLKVAADWRAPVHRNRAEYEWLRFAQSVAPRNSLELYGCSEKLQGFAMEYLDGADVFLWKAQLLEGATPQGGAARTANLLGRLHAASTAPGFDAAPFHNQGDFRQLRLDPYLSYTADKNPDVAEILRRLAETLFAASAVLVHGDVSPKNILFRSDLPILLDAECATMGDASFDPAFCMNHLVLKAFHRPRDHAALLAEVAAFWAAYARYITWEDPSVLEARTALVLAALMLARVDGKSPVEYLDAVAREQVRACALDLLTTPATRVGDVLTRLKMNEGFQ
ncbi:hypothetical protein BV911_17945 [Pseudoruegeria sp. SK021]|nr:hypothetical protein BV911_17945 [Pseudoruegeria sp. SK021]